MFENPSEWGSKLCGVTSAATGTHINSVVLFAITYRHLLSLAMTSQTILQRSVASAHSPLSPAGRLVVSPAPQAGFKREWLTAPSSESPFIERMHWNETLPAHNPKGFSINWDAQPTLSTEEQLTKRALELKACYNISGSIIPIAWLCTDPDIFWAFAIAGPCNADGTKTIYSFHQFATIDLWSLKSHTSFTSTEDFLRNYDGRKAVEVDKVDGGKQKLYEAYTTAGIPYDVQADKRAPDEPYSDEDASGY